MGVMGRLVLGLVLGLVLAYCDSFLVLVVVEGFCGIEGDWKLDLKMDWTGLIR